LTAAVRKPSARGRALRSLPRIARAHPFCYNSPNFRANGDEGEEYLRLAGREVGPWLGGPLGREAGKVAPEPDRGGH
jgi:hypothetical protein